jgi:hypothetical protein
MGDRKAPAMKSPYKLRRQMPFKISHNIHLAFIDRSALAYVCGDQVGIADIAHGVVRSTKITRSRAASGVCGFAVHGRTINVLHDDRHQIHALQYDAALVEAPSVFVSYRPWMGGNDLYTYGTVRDRINVVVYHDIEGHCESGIYVRLYDLKFNELAEFGIDTSGDSPCPMLLFENFAMVATWTHPTPTARVLATTGHASTIAIPSSRVVTHGAVRPGTTQAYYYDTALKIFDVAASSSTGSRCIMKYGHGGTPYGFADYNTLVCGGGGEVIVVDVRTRHTQRFWHACGRDQCAFYEHMMATYGYAYSPGAHRDDRSGVIYVYD